jgi:hypothetical protein
VCPVAELWAQPQERVVSRYLATRRSFHDLMPAQIRLSPRQRPTEDGLAVTAPRWLAQ